MPVIVCRHGTTPWNKEGRWQGQTDVELSDEGIAQAKRHVDSMRDDPLWRTISRIVSSPLKRAHRTAQIIATISADHNDLPVEIDERLKESSLGKFEGMIPEERADHSDVLATLKAMSPAERRDARYDDGLETPREAGQRMLAALNELDAADPTATVCVVTHSQMLYAVMSAVRGEHFEWIRCIPLSWFVYTRGEISDLHDIQPQERP